MNETPLRLATLILAGILLGNVIYESGRDGSSPTLPMIRPEMLVILPDEDPHRQTNDQTVRIVGSEIVMTTSAVSASVGPFGESF